MNFLRAPQLIEQGFCIFIKYYCVNRMRSKIPKFCNAPFFLRAETGWIDPAGLNIAFILLIGHPSFVCTFTLPAFSEKNLKYVFSSCRHGKVELLLQIAGKGGVLRPVCGRAAI